jgi:ribosomal protein L11 methyltransferase
VRPEPHGGHDWLALRATVPVEVADAVANFLHEEGAAGVVLDAHDAAGPPPSDGTTCIEAHFAAANGPPVVAALDGYLASLRALDPSVGPARIETRPLPTVDWAALWRLHHRPRAVGDRLLIAPPWDVPAGDGRLVLVIEPGMAFGTGQHATTRGCLAAIEALVAGGGVASALDVGTGSGVLALALARLGVPRVVALDDDPAVPPVARANLERNGVAGVGLLVGRAAAVRGTFDLVVANLLAALLIAAAGELADRVAAAGRLVLSGILDAQADAVAAAYPGWRIADTACEEGWRTLVLERAVQSGRRPR